MPADRVDAGVGVVEVRPQPAHVLVVVRAAVAVARVGSPLGPVAHRQPHVVERRQLAPREVGPVAGFTTSICTGGSTIAPSGVAAGWPRGSRSRQLHQPVVRGGGVGHALGPLDVDGRRRRSGGRAPRSRRWPAGAPGRRSRSAKRGRYQPTTRMPGPVGPHQELGRAASGSTSRSGRPLVVAGRPAGTRCARRWRPCRRRRRAVDGRGAAVLERRGEVVDVDPGAVAGVGVEAAVASGAPGPAGAPAPIATPRSATGARRRW